MAKKRSFILSNEPVELIIPGYPKGSNLTIINTSYNGRRKNEDGDLEKDFITILFRDNNTGAKNIHIIYEPEYTFYKLDDGYEPPEYNLFFIERDKTVPYTCKYADILKAIAEVTGNIDTYMENMTSGNMKENRKLHTIPSIFMSDMNVENYYRFLFGLSYTNEQFKLSKGFMDIEADISYCNSSFPEPGQVPINAIAYCDDAHGVVYQFLYNDKKNPLVEQYRLSFQKEDVIQELKDFVINAVGGYKKAVKFGIDKYDYKIVFFDDEFELIKKMFQVVNATLPDFVEFWNMAFDLNFIIARIEELGGDPLDIICDDRIPQKFLRYYVDERNKNEYAERGDYVNVSSYIVWLDQMIEFASRRKGRAAYPSFKLDAIGEDVANVKKLDYSHITNDLGMLPYLDMKTFSFYNVMDVIVQKCIEHSTQDLEYVFTKCLVNNTIYPKCHRQSVYLANRFSKDFYDYGYVIGNNKNLWNEKPIIKFPGAAVGDPTHNSEEVMIKINGRPTLISNNDVDFDYSSLYPSIILENNLAPNTQIGRIIIEDRTNPDKQFSLMEHQDMYTSDDDNAKYSRGGEFLENLMSNNHLEFCRRWMRLGDIHQVIEDITEFYKFNGCSGKPIDYNIRDCIYFSKDNFIECVEFLNEDYSKQNPLIFDSKLNKSDKEELLNKIKEGAFL